MEIRVIETTMASGERIIAGTKVDVTKKDAVYLQALGKAVIIDSADEMSDEQQEALEAQMKANMKASPEINTGKDSGKKEKDS